MILDHVIDVKNWLPVKYTDEENPMVAKRRKFTVYDDYSDLLDIELTSLSKFQNASSHFLLRFTPYICCQNWSSQGLEKSELHFQLICQSGLTLVRLHIGS